MSKLADTINRLCDGFAQLLDLPDLCCWRHCA